MDGGTTVGAVATTTRTKKDNNTTTRTTGSITTVLHVEIPIRSSCPTSLDRLRLDWEKYFRQQQQQQQQQAAAPSMIAMETVVPESLRCHVDGTMSMETCHGKRIMRGTTTTTRSSSSSSNTGESTLDWSLYKEIRVHPYILSVEEAAVEELQPSSSSSAGDDELDRTKCGESLQLPHASLQGLWNNLIFDKDNDNDNDSSNNSNIKQNLLNFAHSALLFADLHVNQHIVHWNRLILLHGSPGTGKTSLCKALAQKLAIRMGNRYKRTTLMEIQSHALFSKWFSTSGKLVHRVFELVRDMVQDDPECLICVLIDEIESLASNRSAMTGSGNGSNEPTDALRAVNSLLTSLDRLRSYSNCLILATTNLTDAVDAAFMDRADMKVFVDLPGRHARYEILRSCLQELLRCGIISAAASAAAAPDDDDDAGSGVLLLPYDTVIAEEQAASVDDDNNNSTPSKALLTLATTATGLSGRSLRRLPLQAHAHLRAGSDFNLIRFIETMLQVVEKNAAQSDTASAAAVVVAPPRTSTATAEEADDDLNHQEPAVAVATVAATAEGGTGESVAASPKKPRGRPPGTSAQGHLVKLFRRAPGRPKRTTTAGDTSSPNRTSTTRALRPTTAVGTQASASSLPVVKRGPGRPRKDPVFAEEEEEEGVQQEKTMRKQRGRPPKNAPSITTVAKKSPGRPRKHAIVDGVAKKSPGRPRKHAIVDGEAVGGTHTSASLLVVKRGPGRPRKDSATKSPARPRKHEDTTTTAAAPLEPTNDSRSKHAGSLDNSSSSSTLPPLNNKRKRGRPRKTPLNAAAPLPPGALDLDDENEVPSPSPQQKRKRDRPKGSGTASKQQQQQQQQQEEVHHDSDTDSVLDI